MIFSKIAVIVVCLASKKQNKLEIYYLDCEIICLLSSVIFLKSITTGKLAQISRTFLFFSIF